MKPNFKLIKNLTKQNKLPIVLIVVLNIFLFAFSSIGFLETGLKNDLYRSLRVSASYVAIITYGTLIISCIASFLIGSTQFFYLFRRDGVDFYHSLPIKRENLFTSIYVKGFAQILIPYTIVIIIAFVLSMVFSVGGYNILIVLIKGFFLILLCYNLAILITIICGNIPSVILNTIGFIASIITIVAIPIIFINNYFLPWDNLTAIISKLFISYRPYIYYDEFNAVQSLSTTNISYYYLFTLCLTIIMFLFNLYLFKIRKSENNNKFFAFEIGKKLLKMLYTTAFGLLVFIFISVFTGNSIFIGRNVSFNAFIGIFIGTIIFMALFYLVIEFISSRSILELKKSIKLFPIPALLVFIFFWIFVVNSLTLMFYFPKENKIEGFTLFSRSYNNDYEDYTFKNEDLKYDYLFLDEMLNTFEDEENVKILKEYFFSTKDLIENADDQYYLKSNSHNVRLNYNNSNIIKPNIPFVNEKGLNEQLAQVYSSDEYKENYTDMLNNLENFSFYCDYYSGYSDELKNALIKDIENDNNFTSFEKTEPTIFTLYTTIYEDDADKANEYSSQYGTLMFNIKASYKNTLAFLEENGTLDTSNIEVYSYTLPEIKDWENNAHKDIYTRYPNTYPIYKDTFYYYPYSEEEDDKLNSLGNGLDSLTDAEKFGFIENVNEENLSLLNEKVETATSCAYYYTTVEQEDIIYSIYIDGKLTNNFIK